MRPVVGITCCFREHGGAGYDCVARKYTDAVDEAARCLPVLIPTLGAAVDTEALLTSVDGVLFTGSSTNIEPCHYGGLSANHGGERDLRRDATTLPLIRRAVDAGVAVLALCRGHQELNVAFGGTLHQQLHELEGTLDHREDTTLPEAKRYGSAHEVRLTLGGFLARLLGTERLQVNSLHIQAIDRVATGLVVEAVASDGVVEAVRVEGARRFALGVQWHPEWQAVHAAASRKLFEAFAQACWERMSERLSGAGAKVHC